MSMVGKLVLSKEYRLEFYVFDPNRQHYDERGMTFPVSLAISPHSFFPSNLFP